jgi:uncharacterized protein
MIVRPAISYPGVYVQEMESDVHTIEPVDTGTTAFVGSALRGPVNEPITINSFADFESNFGGLWNGNRLGYAVSQFFLNGGSKAIIVRINSDDAVLNQPLLPGDEVAKTGIYALEKADIFNLLYIPPDTQGASVEASVLASAAKYCEKRRAILLLDPPNTWLGKEEAKSGFPMLGFSTNNGAIYFPNIQAPNPLNNNQVEEFGPCGAIAGIIARTDANRGVWKAPAGLDATLIGVTGLSVPLTDAENGELNPLGINCLRKMPAAGFVVWGARTIVGDDRLASQWKYLPVRRTALFIEETLYRGTQWAVFEPNDEPLWAQLRLNIGVFMHGLFRQGAFQGQSAQDAYFVRCDRTTTEQADIDRGIVNIIVGFAPLKPAEFVVLYIQQIAGQLTV